MKHQGFNMERLRDELRALRHGDILIIAERAADLVPRKILNKLLGDYVQLVALNTPPEMLPTPLLAEVHKFYTVSLSGRYFECCCVPPQEALLDAYDGKNCMQIDTPVRRPDQKHTHLHPFEPGVLEAMQLH